MNSRELRISVRYAREEILRRVTGVEHFSTTPGKIGENAARTKKN